MLDTGRLLVTGGTGFLGGAVLAELIRQPRWSSVLILVRGTDVADGRRRVIESLERFETPVTMRKRVKTDQIVLGDLCTVDDFATDARLREVTEVINCAALAGFGKPKTLWPTNVDGTLAFATLMHTVAPLRRFLHVGTAMSCGVDTPTPVCEDTQLDRPGAVHLVSYTESKIACEVRLRAELPDLPLVVARPSIIVGDTRFGCGPSPSIYWVFRMARALRQFACAADDRVDIVPADYCARALLHLMDKPALTHDLYHVSAGPRWSDRYVDIDRAIADGLGQPPTQGYTQVDYDTIAERHAEFPRLFGPCVVPVMLKAIELYGRYAALDMTFNNDRLLAEGMPPPPRFTDYAGLCARTAEDMPIAEQMQYDFKGISTRAAQALAALTRRDSQVQVAA